MFSTCFHLIATILLFDKQQIKMKRKNNREINKSKILQTYSCYSLICVCAYCLCSLHTSDSSLLVWIEMRISLYNKKKNRIRIIATIWHAYNCVRLLIFLPHENHKMLNISTCLWFTLLLQNKQYSVVDFLNAQRVQVFL